MTLAGALEGLDLANTRFIVISKSGGTPETLVQAIAALAAVKDAGLEAKIPELFLGVTEPADARQDERPARAFLEPRHSHARSSHRASAGASRA